MSSARQKKARVHTATLKLPFRETRVTQEVVDGSRRKDNPTDAHRARTQAEKILLYT
jgi:hypothetical protein